MKVFFCLVLGTLLLLHIDANEDVDARRTQALCFLKVRKCDVDLPSALTTIVNENGELDVNCSTLDKEKECFENLFPSCEFLRNSTRFMRLRIKEYLCDNESAFLLGRDCWRWQDLSGAVVDCGPCSMRTCLEEEFQTVDECSDEEAGLMAGIADQINQYTNHCPVQTN